ncbi:DUF1534 domain-containing protein [Pseudomonas coronafaciens pv. coronafaciens]|uniref:DUF1534 domain-containing protein n=1 Tax=Pseudomonas coronafaciens pv. coronafaciens TaxID=235275 RepID=A0AAE6QC57_9PSED|nr:DUF1534 domain-containing protein [Pseudomonas coronafaciens pv. coronafaciens]
MPVLDGPLRTRNRTQSVQKCVPTLERGHDRSSSGRLSCLTSQHMRLSFLTLQRGNALGDAPRHRSAPRRLLDSGRKSSKMAYGHWHESHRGLSTSGV